MDDFTKIRGIGAATAKKLKAAGIVSFAQLAAASPEDLNKAKVAGGPDDWAGFIFTAGLLAAAALVPPNTTPESEQAGGGDPAVPQAPAGDEIPAGASAGAQAPEQTSAPGGDAGAGLGGGAESPASETPAVTRAGETDWNQVQDDIWESMLGADLFLAIDLLAAAHEIDRVTVVDLAVATMLRTGETPQAFAEAPGADDADGPIPKLAIDEDSGGLVPATIVGPKAGRYRRGHHFTDEPQTLLISKESFDALRADPMISVTLVD